MRGREHDPEASPRIRRLTFGDSVPMHVDPLTLAFFREPARCSIASESWEAGMEVHTKSMWLRCGRPRRRFPRWTQAKYLKPLVAAAEALADPPPLLAQRPEAAWRPLQRVLDSMHAQLQCAPAGQGLGFRVNPKPRPLGLDHSIPVPAWHRGSLSLPLAY